MIMNIICINILGYFSTGKISGAKKFSGFKNKTAGVKMEFPAVKKRCIATALKIYNTFSDVKKPWNPGHVDSP